MDMNFAIGLSQGIAWPWPIAVYLFLAGISGGAVAAAVILNLYRKQAHENTPVLKAASVIGAATILLGMVCLVLDLTNPFNFWRILIYYNPTSVMSLGVMALLVYIPTVCILTLVALRGLLPKVGLGFLDGIVGFFDGWRVVLQWIALVFALTICAYTGFLISALIRFPLINQAVLPALFVASGLSAGMAATKAFACLAFGDRHESCDQHLLHAAEWPVMAAEAHDRSGPRQRERRRAGRLCGLHDGRLGDRVLGRRRVRRLLRTARPGPDRRRPHVVLPERSVLGGRHDVPASLHPLCGPAPRSLMTRTP